MTAQLTSSCLGAWGPWTSCELARVLLLATCLTTLLCGVIGAISPRMCCRFEILTLTQLRKLGSRYSVPIILVNYEGMYDGERGLYRMGTVLSISKQG